MRGREIRRRSLSQVADHAQHDAPPRTVRCRGNHAEHHLRRRPPWPRNRAAPKPRTSQPAAMPTRGFRLATSYNCVNTSRAAVQRMWRSAPRPHAREPARRGPTRDTRASPRWCTDPKGRHATDASGVLASAKRCTQFSVQRRPAYAFGISHGQYTTRRRPLFGLRAAAYVGTHETWRGPIADVIWAAGRQAASQLLIGSVECTRRIYYRSCQARVNLRGHATYA